jgi:tetratricopeptide (TPR) repeat protein
LLIVGLISSLALGLIYMSLRSPWFAHIKAFYVLPAMVPLVALAVYGWKWLARSSQLINKILWVVVLLLAVTVYGSYWVQSDDPQLSFHRGRQLVDQGRFEEAKVFFDSAIKAWEADSKNMFPARRFVIAETYFHLGMIYDQQGDLTEALKQYYAALKIWPDHAGVLNNLAWIRATNPKAELRDGTEAVNLAQRACDLTQYQVPVFVGTLAVAWAEAGKFPEAIVAAGRARDGAGALQQNAVAEKNSALIKLFQAGKPHRDSL